ncbi:MAG: DinB superfamily protein [Bacteroidetes bacterium]|nr:DinB superfamily protein [Bacteroidota bacterium]
MASYSTMRPLLLGPPAGNVLTLLLLLVAVLVSVWLLSVLSKWVTEKVWKGKARMQNSLKEFESLLSMALPLLQSISESESSIRPASDKWSKKEILGHLIDSASNNHQRFVRAQLSSEIRLPEYEQERWVRAQSYETESWENIVELWKSFNLHLLHVAAKIPVDKANSLCFIGENEPVTLEFLFSGYVDHVKHHLQQILTEHPLKDVGV